MIIKNYTVIYRAAAFEKLAAHLRASWPKERGAFLAGTMPDSNRSIFTVTDAYVPKAETGTTSAWYFYHKDLIKAHSWAAAKGRIIIGYAHSHPYQKFSAWSNCQSHTDALIQNKYSLTLSLIISCTKTEWDWDTWLVRHPAPLYTKLYNKNRLYTYPQWITNTRQKALWKNLRR